MMIRKSRILRAAKSEMDPLRSVLKSNTRRRISESVMKAGRAHRRRTFGKPFTDYSVYDAGINGMRKEEK